MERGISDIPALKELKTLIMRLERLKQSGNEAFNAKSYDSALNYYNQAMAGLEAVPNLKFKVVLLANRVASLMACDRCVTYDNCILSLVSLEKGYR